MCMCIMAELGAFLTWKLNTISPCYVSKMVRCRAWHTPIVNWSLPWGPRWKRDRLWRGGGGGQRGARREPEGGGGGGMGAVCKAGGTWLIPRHVSEGRGTSGLLFTPWTGQPDVVVPWRWHTTWSLWQWRYRSRPRTMTYHTRWRRRVPQLTEEEEL
jgi:hypothetical protein